MKFNKEDVKRIFFHQGGTSGEPPFWEFWETGVFLGFSENFFGRTLISNPTLHFLKVPTAP
jgi:hypothetical protein